jgi:hypothetical protein
MESELQVLPRNSPFASEKGNCRTAPVYDELTHNNKLRKSPTNLIYKWKAILA